MMVDTANRLTDTDRETMRRQMDHDVAIWRATVPFWRPGFADVETLQRIACHTIGCTSDDLRDVEIGEIRAMVFVALGLDAEPVPLSPSAFVYVQEGFWHPTTMRWIVHDHDAKTTVAYHRLCEPVYTKRTVS